MLNRPIALIAVSALVGLVAVPSIVLSAPEDDPSYWREGYRQLSELGDGFVVWESSRTGRWRLWRRNLDGSGLRQFSPEENGRDHFCPHLSPDGKTVAYLSYPAGSHTYQPPPKGRPCPLHLINVDGTGDRIIVDSARAYFEDRGAVWISNHELIYIGGDGVTYQIDIRTKQRTRLTKDVHKEYGFLLNRAKTHGVQGRPDFHKYFPQRQTLTGDRNLGGCQPYFSHDGVWGFWTGGAGGPLKRIRLATGDVGAIIGHKDPRMPKSRNYLYFPMLSRCGRLFAFAASPNQHDHFKSDYDIFIAAADPATLELTGTPVRYSFDSACDRFPDVHLADLALGQLRGEAPYTVRIDPPGKQRQWEWSVGGKPAGSAQALNYTFREPGEFTVSARDGKESVRGKVTVVAANPPKLLRTVRASDTEIVLYFDEPVQLRDAKFGMASGTRVAKSAVASDGMSLQVILASKLPDKDALSVSGVSDCAQTPNAMPPMTIAVEKPVWPINREGLLYLWETAKKPNTVIDSATGETRSYKTKACGHARLNHDYAIELGGGGYLVEGADSDLLAGCKKANALTVEAVIRPDNLKQVGPARIVTFSNDPSRRNFTLGQQAGNLIMRLRTPQTGPNGTSPEVTLCPIETDRPAHIVVTYKPGEMVCYKNGASVLRTTKVQGDFSNWDAAHLLVGDEWAGGRDWSGTLEGVAIYGRALDATEVALNASAYRGVLASRPVVESYSISAKLLAKSKMPTLKEIAPYREALAMYEYELVESPAGARLPKKLRVAHWVMLDARPLDAANAPTGKTTRLRVEPFERNPQLESFYMSDTLPEDLDTPLFFAVE